MIKKYLNPLKERISELPVRRKQLLIISCGVSVVLLLGTAVVWSRSGGEEEPIPEIPSVKKDIKELSTASKGVDEREIWVNRIEEKDKERVRELEEVKNQNRVLEQKINVLDEIFQKSVVKTERPQENIDIPQAPVGTNSAQFTPPEFPGGDLPLKKRGQRIFHVGSGGLSRVSNHRADSYMVAGSHAKATLLTGSVAPTAVNAQSNPLPMVLRVIDDGNLPRGFTSRIKDAQIIGSCYGDISSERVYCRLETMSWVETDGTTVERKVEGWVVGEDGKPGLRGMVVDRSGDVARQAMVAGILSSITSFLQYESTKGVFPMTPFGQTNALKAKDALGAAGASGAGNALDKLAEFAIKRAEQMQPVILISSGRVVDVVFKSGVDVSPFEQTEIKLANVREQEEPIIQGEPNA